MDIRCRLCNEDFLFFDTEFVKLKCNHLFHQECARTENNACPKCGNNVGEPQSQQVAIVKKEDDTDNDEASKSKKRSEPDEQFRPVTWTELDRLRQDCNRLLAIFAEHVADVAGTDRKANPIVYMHGVTNAVTRIAYPTVLVKKIMEGLNDYQESTESLYRKDENENLVNFGIPIRYNEETTTTINAVRRCMDELDKWMEIEITRSANLSKWEQELHLMFPNLKEDDILY